MPCPLSFIDSHPIINYSAMTSDFIPIANMEMTGTMTQLPPPIPINDHPRRIPGESQENPRRIPGESLSVMAPPTSLAPPIVFLAASSSTAEMETKRKGGNGATSATTWSADHLQLSGNYRCQLATLHQKTFLKHTTKKKGASSALLPPCFRPASAPFPVARFRFPARGT